MNFLTKAKLFLKLLRRLRSSDVFEKNFSHKNLKFQKFWNLEFLKNPRNPRNPRNLQFLRRTRLSSLPAIFRNSENFKKFRKSIHLIDFQKNGRSSKFTKIWKFGPTTEFLKNRRSPWPSKISKIDPRRIFLTLGDPDRGPKSLPSDHDRSWSHPDSITSIRVKSGPILAILGGPFWGGLQTPPKPPIWALLDPPGSGYIRIWASVLFVHPPLFGPDRLSRETPQE